MPYRLSDGSSADRGIGRATALRLAEAGAHVVVNYVQNDRAATEVVRSSSEFGAKARPMRADISRPENLSGGNVIGTRRIVLSIGVLAQNLPKCFCFYGAS